MLRAAVILLFGLIAAGCNWRMTPPTALDQAVKISVVADEGRSPRAGAYLQAAAAEQIAFRTGWHIRPNGEARLDLSIDKDGISATADDNLGIATRWNYSMYVTALLVTKYGTRTWHGSGTGYAGDRASEPAAIRAAATDAGDALARWLASVDLSPPKP